MIDGSYTGMYGVFYSDNGRYTLTLKNLVFKNFRNSPCINLPKGNVILYNCIFLNNGPRNPVVYANNVKIINSKFSNNNVKDLDDGVVSGNKVSVSNSIFYHNRGGEGGAITGKVVSVRNSVFNRNVGINGAISGNKVTCVNCNFTRNYGQRIGGAIGGNYANLQGCRFLNNKAKESGGAIEIVDKALIKNCLFQSNYAVNYGGAVSLYSSASVISNCVFKNNRAKHDGGAIYMYSMSHRLSNVRFIKNCAESGGAIYAYTSSAIKISNSIFNSNYARHAGAINVKEGGFEPEGILLLSNCRFIRNSRNSDYAAIFTGSKNLRIIKK